MLYDYKEGKKRVNEILNNKLEVIKSDSIPSDDNFTFDNSYYGWVTAIFVDIRNSSELFSKEDSVMVSKIIRSFTSEIIEILRGENNLREIGIRGDCVYAIYTTPKQQDINNIINKAAMINSFMTMLNKLLIQKKYSVIYAGIGIASAQELVVKAGRKNVGINNKVWIGNAVTKASNLSSYGNKNGIGAIVLSPLAYSNTIEIMTNENKDAPSWFKVEYPIGEDYYYHCNLINSYFDKWIEEGMKV